MENATQIRKPWVLWIREVDNLEPPKTILSAGRLEDCRRWQERNPWSLGTPFVVFGGEDLGPLGVDFLSPLGPFPIYRVENAPPWTPDEWKRPDVATFTDGMDAFVRFVRMVAPKLPNGPCWVVCADGDEGALAVALASVRGSCVALSAAPPGVVAAVLADKLGVDISVRRSSKKDFGAA